MICPTAQEESARRAICAWRACKCATLSAVIPGRRADPEVKQKLIAQGLEVRGSTAGEFGQFIDDETRRWSAVIREAGLKGE